MSLTSDILTLNSALQAFTYGQSIVAENIANVDTPGYTSQVLNLESIQDFGGVSVAGVGSTRNTFLYNQLYGQVALQGFTTAQLGALNQLYSILPEIANPLATNGLSAAMNNLSAAWTALAAAPTSTADETTVVNDMQTLANLFNTDSNQLFLLQQNLSTQTTQAVTQVNSLEDQILSLNQQIVELGGQQSAQTSTLIDQREVDAQQLVTLTGASVNYATDGAMILTFSGGTLVDGVNTFHLGTIPSPTIPGMLDIGYVSVPGSTAMADVTTDFTSGTLGGLYSGQSSVEQAVLALNKMASGIIQFSNEVNQSGTAASDGTVNQLFYGDEASDISVNPELATNPSYVVSGNDPLNPGNLATAQAAMTTLNMYSEIETLNPAPGTTGGIDLNVGTIVDPTQSLQSQTANFGNPAPMAAGTMVINAGGNAVSINWTNTETLNQIIAQINQQGGGAFYATLQNITPAQAALNPNLNAGQYVHIYSNAPLSIYDASGNLADALQLGAVLTSSAPINAVPSTGVNQVTGGNALNSAVEELALFTQATAPVNTVTGLETGTVQVGGTAGTSFKWETNQTINAIMAAIDAAAPGGTVMTALYNLAGFTPAEEVSISSQVVGAITAANPLESVSIGDVTGNLTQVLNLNTDTNATKLFSSLTTTVGNTTSAALAEQAQANAMVYATESLQNEGGPKSPNAANGQPQAPVSNVNLGAQLAQAAVYENAYDAAVRLQYVLESMLNFLITQTGSPEAGSAPTGS